MIYGETPYTIEDDRTDRVGIRTVAIAKVWQPDGIGSVGEVLSQVPAAPDLGGGALLIGRQTRRLGGALRTVWIYEGIDGDGRSVTFRTRANTLDYEFSPGFSQVDIGLHPKLQELIDTYQGQIIDGEIYFPPTIDAGAASPLAKSGSGNAKKSPVALLRDFLRMEGTYTCRYLAFGIAGIAHGVGHIAGDLPGTPPGGIGDRNWLKAPVAYQRRGPVYEVMESYWLSGEGGWPVPIYGGAIGSASSSNGGLTTGGLVTGSL